MSTNQLWSACLARADKPDIEAWLTTYSPSALLRSCARELTLDPMEALEAMLIQASQLPSVKLFDVLCRWGATHFLALMPSAKKMCTELLYRPHGSADQALMYVFAHPQLFCKTSGAHNDGYPLTTAIYVENNAVLNHLVEAFPESFHPERVFQAIVLSENTSALKWFWGHPKMQDPPSDFFVRMLQFVGGHYNEFGHQSLNQHHNQIVHALQHMLRAQGHITLNYAHRACRISYEGREDDLAHALWVCGNQGGEMLMSYLSEVINCAQHLKHMICIGQDQSAELLHPYVKKADFNALVKDVSPKMLDKLAKTTTLYARFINSLLHQTVHPYFNPSEKVARRM